METFVPLSLMNCKNNTVRMLPYIVKHDVFLNSCVREPHLILKGGGTMFGTAIRDISEKYI